MIKDPIDAKTNKFMKLKIILFSFFYLPLLENEEKVKMPNKATIFCLVHTPDENPNNLFNNRERNLKIAKNLAGQNFTHKEVATLLHRMTHENENITGINLYCKEKALFIMIIARHCLTHPEDQKSE